MNQIRTIREMLSLTQSALAEGIGCTQGSIHHYESGKAVPPERAIAVIDFAGRRGLHLTMGQVYGTEPLPRSRRAKQVP